MPTGIGSGIAGEVFTDQIGSGGGGSIICPTRYSVNLNGASQIGTESGTSFDLGVDNFSYSFWFKTSASGVSGIVRTDATADGMDIFLSATGLLTVTWTTVTFPTTASLNDGEWHHAVLSVDRLGYWRWYIDGVNTNSADHSSLSGDPVSNTAAIWGAITLSDIFDGNLTELSIWGTALSSSEVLTIYNNMFGSQTCLTDLTFSSGNLIQNGSFNEIGPQLIDNPTFNAPTSPDLITNGDFSAESINLVDNPNFTDGGSDLIVNGIFDTTIPMNSAGSGWYSLTGASFNNVGGVDGLKIERFTEAAYVTAVNLTNGGLITANTSYKISYEVLENNGSGGVYILAGAGTAVNGAITTGVTHTIYITSGANTYLRFYNQTNNSDYTITNVTCKELGADWQDYGNPIPVASYDENGLTITSYNTVSNTNRVLQGAVTAPSKSYKFTYTIHSATLTGANNELQYYNGVTYIDLPTAIIGTPQTFYYTTPSTLTNTSWYFRLDNPNGSTTDNVTISNLTVQELGEGWNHNSIWQFGNNRAIAVSTNYTSGTSLNQSSVLEVGKSYKVSFEVLEITSGAFEIRAGAGGTYSPAVNSVGTYTYYLQATDPYGTVLYMNCVSTTNGAVSNITVQEVDWAFGGGWSLGSNKALATAAAGGDTLYQTGVFTLDKSYKTTFLSTLDSGNCFAEFGSDGFIGQLPTGTASNLFYYQTNEVGDSARIAFEAQSLMTGSISNVLTYQMDPNGYWNIPTANSTQLVLNPTFTNTGPEEVTNGDFSQTVLGSELVVNGDFLSASSWNVNPNWSINTALGVAEADGLSNADINQSVWLPVIGKSYKVTFEVVSRSQGEVLFILGGVTGQAHNTLGIKTEYIVATSTDRLKIDSEDSFIGSVTNVSVKEVLQLVTNGDFTEGTEGVAGGNFEGGLIGTVANSGGAVYTWALNTVAPISGTQDGKLAVTTVGTSTDYPRLGFNGNLALDKSYVLTFDYKVNSGTCYMPTINRGGGSSAYVASTLSGSGTYTFYFQGFGTGDLTLNFRGTNLFDTQLDNVSVKELGVDWTVVDGAGGDTVTFGDSFAEIIKTAGTVVYLQQDYAVTLGASHKLTYTVVENTFTGGGTELGLSGVGAYGGSTLDSSASATPKTVYLTVTDDTPLAALRFYSGDTGGSIKITDISVQELGEGWTVTMSDGSAPTATKYVEFVEAGARFVSDVTAAPFLYLNQNVLSVGKLYKLTCSVAYTGTGGIKAYVGGESFPLTEGVNTFYTSSLSTNSEFRFLRNNTDVDCIISNISVEETGLDWVSPDAGVVNTFSATGLTMTSVNGTGSNTISQSGVTADDQAYKVVYTILGSNLTSGGYLEFYNGTGYMSMPTTIGTNTLHFTRNGTDDAVYLRLSSSSGSTTDTVDIGSITIVEVQGWTLEDGKLVGDLPDLAKSATQGIGAIAGNSYKATMDVAIAEEELITNGSFREVGINLTSPLDFTTWLDSSTSSITANSFTTVGSGGGVYFDLTTNKIYKINVSGVTGDVSLRSRDGGGAGTVLGAFDTDLYFDTNGLGSPNIYIRSNSATTATVTSVSVQEVGQGWGLGAGWSIGDGVVTAASAGAAPISQVVSGFTAGRTYKVKFEVTAVTQGYVRVYAYVGASGAFSNIFSSPTLQTGEYEVDFVFGGTDKTLRFYGSTGGGSDFAGSITNVSVEEVGELKVDIGGAPVQSITTSGTHSLTFTAVDSDPFRIYGSTFTGSVTNIFVTQVAGDTLERWWRVNGNIDTLTDPAPNVASNGIANSITWFNSPLISSDTP